MFFFDLSVFEKDVLKHPTMKVGVPIFPSSSNNFLLHIFSTNLKILVSSTFHSYRTQILVLIFFSLTTINTIKLISHYIHSHIFYSLF